MFVVFFQNAKYRMKDSTLQPTLYRKTWFYQLMAQVGKCSLNAGCWGPAQAWLSRGIWHCDLWAMGSLLQATKPLGDAWVPGPLLTLQNHRITLREPVWKILKPIFFCLHWRGLLSGSLVFYQKNEIHVSADLYRFRHVLISLC